MFTVFTIYLTVRTLWIAILLRITISQLLLVNVLGFRSSGILRSVGVETQLCVPWGENGTSGRSRLACGPKWYFDRACVLTAVKIGVECLTPVTVEKLWVAWRCSDRLEWNLSPFFYTCAAVPIARVPKMASEEISLARGIHCCLYFFCPTSTSTLCCVYVCVRVYIYIYIHTHTHIYIWLHTPRTYGLQAY